MRIARSLVEPAAMSAAGNLARADKDRSCNKARFEMPWQDRQTLLLPALGCTRGSFSPSCAWLSGLAETMRERHNVRYASS
jgi:hypothetical protein